MAPVVVSPRHRQVVSLPPHLGSGNRTHPEVTARLAALQAAVKTAVVSLKDHRHPALRSKRPKAAAHLATTPANILNQGVKVTRAQRLEIGKHRRPARASV
jgi:hypothetical protein